MKDKFIKAARIITGLALIALLLLLTLMITDQSLADGVMATIMGICLLILFVDVVCILIAFVLNTIEEFRKDKKTLLKKYLQTFFAIAFALTIITVIDSEKTLNVTSLISIVIAAFGATCVSGGTDYIFNYK